MLKAKKIKILEYLILTTIIISLIVLIFLAKKVFNDKIETSNSNETENYSITKIIKYQKDLTQSNIYSIPLLEYINHETSTYTTYIISTDNIITNIIEVISINYIEIPTYNVIANYCNSYDSIEDQYKLQCQFKKNTLTIKNNFSIDKISINSIKTNNLEISIPIKANTKLNDYLDNLKKENISYTEVEQIE